jgi:cellobiose phosphorylase
MEAVDRRLVRRESGIIQLLDPPFDKSELNPGYIKGYVPGVRENGGQYTHAAVWAAMAFAALGDTRRAWELTGLINPLNHSRTAGAVSTYKVEPYVVAADVYAIAPHTGRGGWTWYTGAAGWYYRHILESLLGFRRQGGTLQIVPCIPAEWDTYTLHYRFGETMYHIKVSHGLPGSVATASRTTLDGIELRDNSIPLNDDRVEHVVVVTIPRAAQG